MGSSMQSTIGSIKTKCKLMKNLYERVGIQVSHQLVFQMSKKVSTPARIKVWDKVGDILYEQVNENLFRVSIRRTNYEKR
jgi:hypothetical protein